MLNSNCLRIPKQYKEAVLMGKHICANPQLMHARTHLTAASCISALIQKYLMHNLKNTS